MSTDEQEIRELVATWMDATKRADTQTVLSLMTDDVIFLVPGQPPMGKAAFAAATNAQSGLAGKMVFEGESEIQEIQVHDDWAFMWTKLKVTATPPGGTSVHRAGHTLSILHKQNGKWRLARDANLLATMTKT